MDEVTNASLRASLAGALRTAVRHPLLVGVVPGLLVLPGAALVLATGVVLLILAQRDFDVPSLLPAVLLWGAGGIAGTLAYAFACGALASVVREVQLGRRARLRAALVSAFRSTGGLAGVAFSKLAVLGGTALALGRGVVALDRLLTPGAGAWGGTVAPLVTLSALGVFALVVAGLLPAVEIAALEGCAGFRALPRSLRRTAGHRLRALGVLAASGLASLLVALPLWALLGRQAAIQVTGEWLIERTNELSAGFFAPELLVLVILATALWVGFVLGSLASSFAFVDGATLRTVARAREAAGTAAPRRRHGVWRPGRSRAIAGTMAGVAAFVAVLALAWGWLQGVGSERDGWWPAVTAARRGDPVYRGRPLREWVQALASANAAERLEAAQVATLFESEDAGAAVPSLLPLLGDPDVVLRRLAAQSLANLVGPADTEAVPVLLRGLEDRDSYVRLRAAGALGAIGARDAAALEALVARLEDPAAAVQREAIDALLGAGEWASVLPVLAEALDAEDEAVQQWAAARFAVVGEAAVPVLEAYVHRDDAVNPVVGVAALATIGRPAAPALARTLRAESPPVAWAARQGLVALGPDAEGALPWLREIFLTPPPPSPEEAALPDPRRPSHGAAMGMNLQGMGTNLQAGGGSRGPVGPATTPPLPPREHARFVLKKVGAAADPIFVEAFGASAANRRSASRLASELRGLGPERLAPHGPEFLRLSREGSREIRDLALGLAADAAEADPTLVESFDAEIRSRLEGDDYYGRRAALEVLQRRRSAGASAIPLVVECLGAERPTERTEAARTLKAICPGRTECVAPLVEALDDENERARIMAMSALGGVGAAAAEAVPTLIERFEADPRARATIAQSLGAIGPAAGSSLPQLAALARDATDRGQRDAIEALPRIGRPDEARAVLLEVALAAESARRTQPLRALAALGPHAEPALPELGRMLTQTDFRPYRAPILDVYVAVGPAAVPHLEKLISEAGGSAPRDLRAALAKLESQTAAVLE